MWGPGVSSAVHVNGQLTSVINTNSFLNFLFSHLVQHICNVRRPLFIINVWTRRDCKQKIHEETIVHYRTAFSKLIYQLNQIQSCLLFLRHKLILKCYQLPQSSIKFLFFIRNNKKILDIFVLNPEA